MARPDLTTLACVNSECQHYGQSGLDNLTIRKVYGRDGIRLLRCRSCQDEFSERRGTALFNTKLSEAQAIDVIDHLDEGCSVRSTSRLTKGMSEDWPSRKKRWRGCSKSVGVMPSVSIIKRSAT